MKENRWQVYAYRDGAAHKEGSRRLLRDAQEEAVRCLENAKAVIIFDRQKNRFKDMYGYFPLELLQEIEEGKV